MVRPTLSPKLSTPILALVAALVGGCLEHPLKEVEYEKAIEKQCDVEVYTNRDVDVLFVIDNSGSMAEEQALLAQNFESFVAVLDDVEANYRIAVVTTDNGNPRDPKVTPDGGDFRLSSCLDRLSEDGVSGGDFITEIAGGTYNAEYACSDRCALSDADLVIRPTAIGDGSGEAPRPWLENLYGVTNLPDGISVADAFECFGPQGITGSGFESPLESMRRALQKADAAGEAQAGFLRESAHLAVVVITDEVDCSFNPEHAAIFRDNTTFWSDPDAPVATSAVCWNAGVACDGDGADYGACRSMDYDASGAPAAAPEDAVLYPVQRYVDFLQAIEGEKQARDANLEVMVSAIVGVPGDYGPGMTAIPYGASADPIEQDEFGVAPGCTFNLGDDDPLNDSRARPPVRLRDFAEAMKVGEAPGLYSICQDDYSAVLSQIADKIRQKLRPACVRSCVRDETSATTAIEPSCTIWEDAAGKSARIEPCELGAGGWEFPDDAEACAVFLGDRGGDTPSVHDDMSVDPETGAVTCADEGWNLEVKVLRRAPAPSGARVRAVCEVAEDVATACPNLPDDLCG